jgi:antitoxin ParD1/3/4
MPDRHVEISEDDAEFIDDTISAGRFETASDVVREALGLLKLHQENDELRSAALKAAIEIGIEAARRGEVVEIEPGKELEYLQRLGRTGKRPA